MSACQDADVKVEFKPTKIGFTIVFHRFDKAVDKMGRVVDDKFLVPSGTRNGTRNSDDYSTRLIEAIKINPKLTYDALAELLSIPRRTISREMKKLQESGKIERIGANKGGEWIVK